jgi:hypothetical protein
MFDVYILLDVATRSSPHLLHHSLGAHIFYPLRFIIRILSCYHVYTIWYRTTPQFSLIKIFVRIIYTDPNSTSTQGNTIRKYFPVFHIVCLIKIFMASHSMYLLSIVNIDWKEFFNFLWLAPKNMVFLYIFLRLKKYFDYSSL